MIFIGCPFGVHETAAQSKEKVTIIEKKTKKRIELFAENLTERDQDVFFMVKGSGFRRSSSRPVLKKIPAKGKVHMITLIPLVGQEQQYDYTLIVQDEAQEVTVRKDHGPIALKLPVGLIIFTKKNDPLSNEISSYLKKSAIEHKEIDLNGTHLYRELLNKHLSAMGILKDNVKAPVVFHDRQIVTGIGSLSAFKTKLEALSKK